MEKIHQKSDYFLDGFQNDKIKKISYPEIPDNSQIREFRISYNQQHPNHKKMWNNYILAGIYFANPYVFIGKGKIHFYRKYRKMSKIKDKLSNLNKEILEKDFLEKLVQRFGYTYNMEDLSNLGYISVIKNGKRYYNNQIKTIKNPYIIGATYADFKDYMFGGPNLFNKYGFTTQVSNIFTVYNLQYSKEIEILGIKYDFKKIKKEFLYGKDTKMINYRTLYFMNRERCFLEFVRTYATYDDKFFIDSYQLLNKEILVKMMKKYPIKSVLDKVKNIEKCI